MNAELMSVDKNFSYAVKLSVNLFLSPSLGGELFISPPCLPWFHSTPPICVVVSLLQAGTKPASLPPACNGCQAFYFLDVICAAAGRIGRQCSKLHLLGPSQWGGETGRCTLLLLLCPESSSVG